MPLYEHTVTYVVTYESRNPNGYEGAQDEVYEALDADMGVVTVETREIEDYETVGVPE